MQWSKGLARPAILVPLVLGVIVVVVAAAFEPISRGLAANDVVCFGCHLRVEYDPTIAGSPSKRHPATPEEGDQARCVDCHVPEGWVESSYIYGHILAGTDLFGHTRGIGFFAPAGGAHGRGEMPTNFPAEATRIGGNAYLVRDRLLRYDSVTCRSCHLEAEIKPKRKRGKRAHKNAVKNQETCIECHYNVAHREVEARDLSKEELLELRGD